MRHGTDRLGAYSTKPALRLREVGVQVLVSSTVKAFGACQAALPPYTTRNLLTSLYCVCIPKPCFLELSVES